MSSDSKIRTTLAELREDYGRAGLRRAEMNADPVEQFRVWFREAQVAGLREPNAVTLATSGADGQPTARVVLLKGFGTEGFDFFTNYESRKGRELAENPRASLSFFWNDLQRQVILRGGVSRLSREESEVYFQSRPYGSRIGAWVSEQSTEIPDREWLEKREQELRADYPDTGEPDCVPLPPNWGGYRLAPASFEFWQGRPNRLHDRIEYRRSEREEAWETRRLSP